MTYLWEWIVNLFRTIMVIIGVCLFMYIFMRIFYPDAIDFSVLVVQGWIQIASGLKLWPILILIFILAALPRRKRRHGHA